MVAELELKLKRR